MTSQIYGIIAALCLLAWLALGYRHLRTVAAWAETRTRARIPRDDQPRALALAAAIAVVLSIGMILRMPVAFALTILLSAAGTIAESAVRVVPHLRSSEQKLAMDHIILSAPLLATLIAAVMGWNRLWS